MGVTAPHIGELRTRVAFENNTGKVRLGAGMQDNYQPYLVTWGKFEQGRGRRAEDAFEQVIETTYNLWVRWQDSMAGGISKSTRVIIDNRFFAVTSFEKIGQKKFFLYLTLIESQG